MTREKAWTLPGYFTRNELKRRGWSTRLVTKLLGEPDRTIPNPKYRRAAPIQLYARDTVLAAEKEPAYHRHMAKRSTLVEIAQQAVETKKRRTLELVDGGLDARVPVMPLEELARRALAHYHARQRDDEPPAEFHAWDVPDTFRDRVCVNYLRHRATPYDDVLDTITGRVGHDDARRRAFDLVCEQISAAYPNLADEAARQFARRFGTPGQRPTAEAA